DLALADASIGPDDAHVRIRRGAAAGDASHAEHADVGVVIEAGDLQLQRTGGIDVGRWHVPDDGFKKRVHVAGADLGLQAGVTVQRGGVNHGEVELRIGGAEPVE